MLEEYKIDLAWGIGGSYFVVMIGACLLGLMQASWHDKSDQHIMRFRKPNAFRLGAGMFSLLMLAMALFFALTSTDSVKPRDLELAIWFTWLWKVPLSLAMAVLFVYIAEPQDVSIDLETRTCLKTAGWRFHRRRHSYPLTTKTCVCVCSGGQSYYVFLVIGGGTRKSLLLARPERKRDAAGIAQEIADKLSLPAKEATLSTLSRLG